MATQIIKRVKSAVSIGNAADVIAISEPVKQVEIINMHATQSLTVVPYYGETAAQAQAAAEAANVAAAITATSDGGFRIAPLISGQNPEKVVIVKTKKPQFVAFTCIATGAATLIDVRGTLWTHGN